jgi:phage shock protein PspC (stress-responsive transcriptional regulator)
MNGVQHYFDWGVVHISIANLIVIVLMIIVFALAVLLPFPGGRGTEQ